MSDNIFMGFIQFLSGNNVKSSVIPVNPDEITFSDGRHVERVPMANAIELVRPGAKIAKTISFSSFFPEDLSPDQVFDIANKFPISEAFLPLEWVDFFEFHLKDSNHKLKFYIHIPGRFIFFNSIVENFQWSYRGGWGSDIIYELSLSETREIFMRTASLSSVDFLPGLDTTLRQQKNIPDVYTAQPEEDAEEVAREFNISLHELLRQQAFSGPLWHSDIEKRLNKKLETIYAGASRIKGTVRFRELTFQEFLAEFISAVQIQDDITEINLSVDELRILRNQWNIIQREIYERQSRSDSSLLRNISPDWVFNQIISSGQNDS